MTTEPNVSLDIRCPYCWGEITVECVDWGAEAELVPADVTCPYCSRVNEVRLPARVVWTARTVQQKSNGN